MDICYLMLVAVLTNIFQLLTKGQEVIEIDEFEGNDTIYCIEGTIPCLSLAYAVNQTNGSVLYTLKSTSITVNTVIEFVQRKELSIVGDNQEGTTIVCTCGMDSSCGMIFNGSESIILSGLRSQDAQLLLHLQRKKLTN